MKPAMFHDMTHVLGAPNGWDAKKNGVECLGLPVKFDPDYPPTITSCWVLDSEELAALVAGGRVCLTVVGTTHPPVVLTVREADK